jgi:hypothetical protein
MGEKASRRSEEESEQEKVQMRISQTELWLSDVAACVAWKSNLRLHR